MSKVKVLAVLPAVAAVCTGQAIYSGFGAPILFGLKQWWAAMHRDPADREDDYLA